MKMTTIANDVLSGTKQYNKVANEAYIMSHIFFSDSGSANTLINDTKKTTIQIVNIIC